MEKIKQTLGLGPSQPEEGAKATAESAQAAEEVHVKAEVGPGTPVRGGAGAAASEVRLHYCAGLRV